LETRRLLLAVTLSLAVLLVWGYFFGPEPVPRTAHEEPVVTAPATDAGDGERPRDPPATAADSGKAEDTAQEVPRTTAERVGEESERAVALETDDVRLEFSNRGAQLVSYRLKAHASGSGDPVDLVRARSTGPYPLSLLDDDEPHPLNDALFAVEAREGGAGAGLHFRYAGPEGVAEKTFRLREDGLLEVDVRLEGGDDERWGILFGPDLRNPTEEEQEGRFALRSAVFRRDGDTERIKPDDLEASRAVPGNGLSWVGLEDNYFLTAVLVDSTRTSLAEADVVPLLVEPAAEEGAPASFRTLPGEDVRTDAEDDLPRGLELVLRPAGETFSALTYWGPKQYETLTGLPGELDETIDLGFLRPIAVPFLIALHWVYENVVRNYGWAIVLLTFAVKLVLLPITHKSYSSMRKMQEVQPKLKALQAKYKPKLKDKSGRPNLEVQRKMNEEMMALYKSEGVNPASGCLPMLLQMPVFFAFYKILLTAVELRNAPWVLWIHDLSAADPFFVLPVVMAGTQFLQQKMSPSAADPMQRRIFQLMPIFLLVIFIGMPAGLVLYWLTNNVLTIIQQWTYNHLKKRGGEAQGVSEKPVKSRPRRAQAK
jgi:YidC/Oxa1 family membrane protein insertase